MTEVEEFGVAVTGSAVADVDRERLWHRLSEQLDTYDSYESKVRRQIALIWLIAGRPLAGTPLAARRALRGADLSGLRSSRRLPICVHVMGVPDRHLGAMPHVDMPTRSGTLRDGLDVRVSVALSRPQNWARGAMCRSSSRERWRTARVGPVCSNEG